jgi:ribosomal protein L11 methyltransferase
MRRVAVRVPRGEAEIARARMLELAPEGFEERERGDEIELAAYTDALGGARIARAFGVAHEDEVPSDWQDRWRRFHRPVRAGPFWVGPSWEGAPEDSIAIVIDPGLAFGTGAHATTRLCLELLATIEPGSALDAGCGSGVLAVGAAKLGCRPVYALDDDPFAVEVTCANAVRNDVIVEARCADVLHVELPPTDIVVANIARPSVESLGRRVRSNVLITSGYLPDDRVEVPAFRHVERRVLDGWAADRFSRPT